MKRLSGVFAVAAAAALLASCGAEDDGSGSTPSVGAATFTGAVTGGLSEVVIAIDSDPSAQTPTSFTFSGASAGISFSTTIELTGYALQAGTFTAADATVAEGSITANSLTYGMVSGSAAGSDAVGSFTLTISNAGSVHTASDVHLFLGVHGTLTATFNQDQSASGAAANVSITF